MTHTYTRIYHSNDMGSDTCNSHRCSTQSIPITALTRPVRSNNEIRSRLSLREQGLPRANATAKDCMTMQNFIYEFQISEHQEWDTEVQSSTEAHFSALSSSVTKAFYSSLICIIVPCKGFCNIAWISCLCHAWVSSKYLCWHKVVDCNRKDLLFLTF